jgi:hypothetical protein
MARVTIGVPVYNGVTLIRECLECLVAQTYDDLQIVVSDNCSTDGTSEICAEFAARHDNVRHVRQPATTDAFTNFCYLLDTCDTPLFMWRAYDDLSALDYVERLVACFDADPGCELAVGAVRLISLQPDGSTPTLWFPYPDVAGLDGVARIEKMLMECSASWVYGLWNREVAHQVTHHVARAFPFSWGSDHCMLFPLILRGTIRGDDSVEFLARLDDTKGARSQGPGYKAAEMKAMRDAFVAEAGRVVRTLSLDPAQHRALDGVVQRYLDKVLFSRSKIRRTRLRESIPFGWGLCRR